MSNFKTVEPLTLGTLSAELDKRFSPAEMIYLQQLRKDPSNGIGFWIDEAEAIALLNWLAKATGHYPEKP